MRKIAKIAALLAAFSLALGFVSCSNSSDGPGYVPGPTGAYTVTVTGGTATPSSAAAGTTITIKADNPSEGKAFYKWTTTTAGVKFASATSAETTFVMPASNVAVTANFNSTLDLSTVTADTVIKDNTIVTGTLAGNYKISIADGATVTLNGVGINNGTSEIKGRDISGLTCEGDATIVIADGSENTIKFMRAYSGSDGGAGIFVPANKTLTINGNTGILNATGTCAGIGANKTNGGNVVINGGVINASGSGAGIGGTEYVDFGNITITGGTVTARSTSSNSNAGIGSGSGKSCGNISITGGTVTATGRYGGAGIGSGGNSASCGTITIANTVTKVTATKGTNATDSVGRGKNCGACGAVTIGGTVYWDGSAYKNDGATVLGQSPYTYQPSPAPGPTPGTTLDLSTVTADTTVADGMTITGTLANNVKISIADGATVTLKNASINADESFTTGDYAGLNCLGDATITLEAGTTNTVKGFKITYPGIHVPSGKTLTINGTGALAASPNTTNVGMGATGAGIGGGVGLSCGNIVIAGGTITASSASHSAGIGCGGNSTGTQTCGNITITGGTVTATCNGSYGAGIGAGINGECGNISITGGTVTASGNKFFSGGAGIGCGGTQSTVGTITIADTVTKVTAVKGYNAKSIGMGFDSGDSGTCVCGTITIGGTVYWDGSAYKNDGATVLGQSPYTYPPLKYIDLGDAGNFYYSDGETWRDAKGRSENTSCAIVLADLEHAIFKFNGSDQCLCVGTGIPYTKVLPDDVINGDLTYSWQ